MARAAAVSGHIQLQPGLRTVAAWGYLRLQPGLRTVAALGYLRLQPRATYTCSLGYVRLQDDEAREAVLASAAPRAVVGAMTRHATDSKVQGTPSPRPAWA